MNQLHAVTDFSRVRFLRKIEEKILGKPSTMAINESKIFYPRNLAIGTENKKYLFDVI